MPIDSPINILLVDDDADDAELFRIYLSRIAKQRYHVDEARSFAVASDEFRLNRHDIYFVDYRLGADDGIDLIRNAVGNGCRKPIIVLTGRGGMNVDIGAMEAGATDYLDKEELTPATLERTIRYAISQTTTQNALRNAKNALELRVTERTEELRRSQASLLQILDNSPSGVSVISLAERKRLYVNRRYIEMFGGQTEEEFLGQHITDSFVDSKKLQENWSNCKRDGYVSGSEELRTRLDGTVWWCLADWRLLPFGGEPSMMVWHYDISDLKRVEMALTESRARLQTIIDTAVDGIITIDNHGIIESFSPAAEQIFGYDGGEVVGENISVLMPETHARQHDQHMHDYLETGVSKIIGIGREVVGRRKNGREFPLEISISELVIGNQPKFTGIVRDITARKAAETELSAKTRLENLLRITATEANRSSSFEEALRTCLVKISEHTGWPAGHVYVLSDEDDDHLVPSGIRHVVEPGEIEKFVETRERLKFGRGVGLPGGVLETAEAAWTDNVNDELHAHQPKPADNAAMHSAFAFPVLASGKVVAVLEFLDGSADGPEDSLLATFSLIGDQLGRVFERGKSELALRAAKEEVDEANRDLELKVDERTHALRQAIHEVETSSQVKTEFLANMSHELRTPLNSIIGFSEIIMEGMFGPLENQYRQYGKNIHTSGEHLLNIIADILDISKVEAAALELIEEKVDLAKLTTACKIMVEGRATEAGVKLDFDLDENLPALYADPLRVKQILLNLIGNAIKFTPRGGKIRVTCKAVEGNGIRIWVEDTGIGIAADDIPGALEKFGQVRDGYMQAHEGAGLGLAVAVSLVKLHQGTLEIESNVGEGTTVIVSFPQERAVKPAN